jgi:hypothetical protein
VWERRRRGRYINLFILQGNPNSKKQKSSRVRQTHRNHKCDHEIIAHEITNLLLEPVAPSPITTPTTPNNPRNIVHAFTRSHRLTQLISQDLPGALCTLHHSIPCPKSSIPPSVSFSIHRLHHSPIILVCYPHLSYCSLAQSLSRHTMSWSRLAQSACSSPRNALASACGEGPIRCVGKDGTREERDALGAFRFGGVVDWRWGWDGGAGGADGSGCVVFVLYIWSFRSELEIGLEMC